MQNRLAVFIACLTIACASDVDSTALRGHADLVFLSGAVYTVDPGKPWAEAVAIRGGRIATVGTDAEVRPYVGNDTRGVDLGGRMLLPGFHDAHLHPVYSGLDSLECWLGGLTSVPAVLEKLSACVASGSRRGDWLVGGGWSVALFPDGNAPKALLDEVAPDVPVVLMDENGHAVWVSSKALERAGVDRSTPNPPAGVIERDPETGEATGTLRESATELVYAHVPAP